MQGSCMSLVTVVMAGPSALCAQTIGTQGTRDAPTLVARDPAHVAAVSHALRRELPMYAGPLRVRHVQPPAGTRRNRLHRRRRPLHERRLRRRRLYSSGEVRWSLLRPACVLRSRRLGRWVRRGGAARPLLQQPVLRGNMPGGGWRGRDLLYRCGLPRRFVLPGQRRPLFGAGLPLRGPAGLHDL